MELFKPLKSLLFTTDQYLPNLKKDTYIEYFKKAKDFTMTNYDLEFKQITSVNFNEVEPELFFRQYLWVSTASGFSSKVATKIFEPLQCAYRPIFISLRDKNPDFNIDQIRQNVLSILNNERKFNAAIEVAKLINEKINSIGWIAFRNNELNTPDKLQDLMFIGPITKFHLARNLGIKNVVKPDLHLTRLARHWKLETPQALCEAIQKEYKMDLGLIDYILFNSARTFGSK